MGKEEIKLVANNKKAYHDYFIDEKYEAGIELHGTEVKSIRMGKCSIKESFIRIENGEELQSIENTSYTPSIVYKVGEIVKPDSFDEDRWNECSHGIHFFINKQDALNY